MSLAWSRVLRCRVQRQRGVKRDVTRSRAGPHHRVTSLHVAQCFAFDVETIQEHAVESEVSCEDEAI